MAARRTNSARERYADRYRGIITFGSDASTAIFETFQTGMAAKGMNRYAWLILGAHMQPNFADGLGNVPDINTSAKMVFQLALGTQDAFLDGDDAQVIAQTSRTNQYTTNGGNDCTWPIVFPIMSPLPTFSNYITVGMQALNSAEYNSQEWIYEIAYVPIKIDSDDILEYLAAYGQV